MADRGHAQADQVVGRQLRQDLGIDIVVAERWLVLFEPQPAQPRRHIHVVILSSESFNPPLPRIFLYPSACQRQRLKYAQ
jgi:hypothetical protein